MNTRKHSKGASAGDKTHLGLGATRWATRDQSRSIEGNHGQEPAHSFRCSLHKDLKANYFAWVQRFIHHLAFTGLSRSVLANVSALNQSAEDDIVFSFFLQHAKP